MRHALVLSLSFAMCILAVAQDHAAHPPAKPATLMSGYGDLHHPVSTSNPQAQQFFDQGLRLRFTPSTTTRRRARFSARQNSIPSSRWPIGESRRPSGRTTTIPPATSVSPRRTPPYKRPSIFRPTLPPSNRPTYKPWRCVSPPIPRPTAARRPRPITTPCAKCRRTFPTIWMPPHYSRNRA